MKITIIGAGGVAQALIPTIALTLGLKPGDHEILIMDKDSYEDRNGARQPLAKLHPGKYKAEAIKEHLLPTMPNNVTLTPVIDFFKSHTLLPDDTDLVIAAVDNGKARLDITTYVTKNDLPLIIAANETTQADVFMWYPQNKQPWETYPELIKDDGTSVDHCTDTPVLEEFPQLPIANLQAAAGALWFFQSFMAIRDMDKETAREVIAIMDTEWHVTEYKIKSSK